MLRKRVAIAAERAAAAAEAAAAAAAAEAASLDAAPAPPSMYEFEFSAPPPPLLPARPHTGVSRFPAPPTSPPPAHRQTITRGGGFTIPVPRAPPAAERPITSTGPPPHPPAGPPPPASPRPQSQGRLQTAPACVTLPQRGPRAPPSSLEGSLLASNSEVRAANTRDGGRGGAMAGAPAAAYAAGSEAFLASRDGQTVGSSGCAAGCGYGGEAAVAAASGWGEGAFGGAPVSEQLGATSSASCALRAGSSRDDSLLASTLERYATTLDQPPMPMRERGVKPVRISRRWAHTAPAVGLSPGRPRTQHGRAPPFSPFLISIPTAAELSAPSPDPLGAMPPPGTPTEVRSRTPAAGSSASNKSPEPQPQSPPVIVHAGTPATAHKWE